MADNSVHHEKVLRVFLEDERKISPNLLVMLYSTDNISFQKGYLNIRVDQVQRRLVH